MRGLGALRHHRHGQEGLRRGLSVFATGTDDRETDSDVNPAALPAGVSSGTVVHQMLVETENYCDCYVLSFVLSRQEFYFLLIY